MHLCVNVLRHFGENIITMQGIALFTIVIINADNDMELYNYHPLVRRGMLEWYPFTPL